MQKVLCIKSINRKSEQEEFTKDKEYEVFDIDVDYYDINSLQLEIFNNQHMPHIVSCIEYNKNSVKNEDWYRDNFFKEHFIFKI